MRKILFLLAGVVIALSMEAQTVTSTAGGLSALVTNHSTTSLTVKGVIDARDFKFMCEELTALSSLNLQSATVAAYESPEPLYGNITNYAANEVPAMAFAAHPSLTSVTMPSSATSIGMGAFAGCSLLNRITLFDGLSVVAPYAFSATNLVTVTIPVTVSYLGVGAFSHCHALTTVKIGTGTQVSLEVGDEAFLDCSALTTLSLGSHLTSLGARSLAGTAIKTIDLSQSTHLTHVGDFAMVAGQATTVKFPSSVQVLGEGVLLYSKVTTVNMPSSLTEVPPFMLAGSPVTQLELGSTNVEQIGDYAFYRLTSPAEVVLPASVSYIGTRAMDGMSGLRSLRSFASTVPALGENVWNGVNQSAVTLYVPSVAMADYSVAEQWKEFNIQVGTKMGDVNGDGIVDVTDVNLAIDYILGKATPVFIFSAADIDGNGIIDVSDVNSIIDIILGRVSYDAPLVPDTDELITIDDFSIAPGESRLIDIKLTNASRYAAMQCDIVLPDGLEVVDNSIEVTSNTPTHEVACVQEGNKLRLLCYSFRGAAMKGDGDNSAVVRMTVCADASLPVSSQIILDGGVLATTHNEPRHCMPSLTLVNSTTGITPADADRTGHYRVWAQEGTIVIEADEPAQAQLVKMNGMSTPLAVMSGHNEYTDVAPGFYIVRVNSQSYKVVVK